MCEYRNGVISIMYSTSSVTSHQEVDQLTPTNAVLGLGEKRLKEGGKEGKREKMRKKGEKRGKGEGKKGKRGERRKKERRALI